jgi:SAM-dependent methyltransferase
MSVSPFYEEVLGDLLRANILDTQMRVLVVCGGTTDRDTLYQNGFQSVVISNITPPLSDDLFAPFEWVLQDAEHLTFDDNTFDFCIVHSGLHHCYSPHRALLEMYRVARKGILLFEPYDNFLTRLGVRLRFGQDYEHAAVFARDSVHGGVGNSSIPNYVYRFTEREIVKTTNSFAPYGATHCKFMYRMRVPWSQLKQRKSKIVYLAVLLAFPLLKAIEIVAPKQSNNFAAVVLKPKLPDELHPWLTWDHGTPVPNRQWLSKRYHATRNA